MVRFECIYKNKIMNELVGGLCPQQTRDIVLLWWKMMTFFLQGKNKSAISFKSYILSRSGFFSIDMHILCILTYSCCFEFPSHIATELGMINMPVCLCRYKAKKYLPDADADFHMRYQFENRMYLRS